MEVDYDVYAEGESLLGWLNCTARSSPPSSRSMPAKSERHLGADTAAPAVAEAEIAHLKMTLSPDQALEAPSPR